MIIMGWLMLWLPAQPPPPDPDEAELWEAQLEHWREHPADLNTATADELARLPGFDARLASLVVRYREMNGPFRRMAELTRVPGVDAALVALIEPYARVRMRWDPPEWEARHRRRVAHTGVTDAWRVRVRHGAWTAHAGDATRFAEYAGARLRVVAGDVRAARGLGLVRNAGLRAASSATESDRHGTRLGGATSAAGGGRPGVAVRVGGDGWAVAAYPGGGRVEGAARNVRLGYSVSGGAQALDAGWLGDRLRLDTEAALDAHGRRAWLSEGAWRPAGRLRLFARHARFGRGFDAPDGLYTVRFGRDPVGEVRTQASVSVRGWHAAVEEAVSGNAWVPEVRRELRLGHARGPWGAELRVVEGPAGSDRRLRVFGGGAARGWTWNATAEVHGTGTTAGWDAGWKGRGGSRVRVASRRFDARDWDDRLYVWESEGFGSGRIVPLHGAGRRSSLTLEQRLGPWLRAALRAARTDYDDRWGESGRWEFTVVLATASR